MILDYKAVLKYKTTTILSDVSGSGLDNAATLNHCCCQKHIFYKIIIITIMIMIMMTIIMIMMMIIMMMIIIIIMIIIGYFCQIVPVTSWTRIKFWFQNKIIGAFSLTMHFYLFIHYRIIDNWLPDNIQYTFISLQSNTWFCFLLSPCPSCATSMLFRRCPSIKSCHA